MFFFLVDLALPRSMARLILVFRALLSVTNSTLEPVDHPCSQSQKQDVKDLIPINAEVIIGL